jgi:hypothetical protein
MFIQNLWTDYILVISALSVCYYAFVVIRFYRTDIQSWIQKRSQLRAALATNVIPTATDVTVEYEDQPEIIPDAVTEEEKPDPVYDQEELFEMAEELSNHLKVAIKEAHEKNYSKSDLVMLLQMTLSEYTAFSGTAFQLSINNLIQAECEKYGPVHLQEDDRTRIWSQV